MPNLLLHSLTGRHTAQLMTMLREAEKSPEAQVALVVPPEGENAARLAVEPSLAQYPQPLAQHSRLSIIVMGANVLGLTFSHLFVWLGPYPGARSETPYHPKMAQEWLATMAFPRVSEGGSIAIAGASDDGLLLIYSRRGLQWDVRRCE